MACTATPEAIEFELPGGGERTIALAFEPTGLPVTVSKIAGAWGWQVRSLTLRPSV